MTQEQFNTMMTAINATNAQRGFNGYHFAAPPNKGRKLRKGGPAKGGERAGEKAGGGKGGKGGKADGNPDNRHKKYQKKKKRLLTKMILWVRQALLVKKDATSGDALGFSADITKRVKKIAEECRYTPTDDWVAKYTLLADNLPDDDHTYAKDFFRAINTNNDYDAEGTEKKQHLKEVSFFLMLLLNAHKFETKEDNEFELAIGMSVRKYLKNSEIEMCKEVADQILQICFSALFKGGEGSKGFNTNPYERANRGAEQQRKGTFDGFKLDRTFKSGSVSLPKDTQVVHLANTSATVLKKVHVHSLKVDNRNWLQVEFYVAAEKDEDFDDSYLKLPGEADGFAHAAIKNLLRENLKFVNCYSTNDSSTWTMGGETFNSKMKDFEYGNLPYTNQMVTKFFSDQPELLKLAEALKVENVMKEGDKFSGGYARPVTTDLHDLTTPNVDLNGVINTFLPSLGINSRRTSMLSWN
jgi:hypothetical protein